MAERERARENEGELVSEREIEGGGGWRGEASDLSVLVGVLGGLGGSVLLLTRLLYGPRGLPRRESASALCRLTLHLLPPSL